MIGRRRFLKLVLGLGSAGVGFSWLNRHQTDSPVTLGQASFESVKPTTTTVLLAETVPVPVVAQPVELLVISKQAWGAAPVVGTFVEHEIQQVTIHHTGSLLSDNADAPGRLREHQAYHQVDQGWPDLAYHFVVDRNGHIYEGRPTWAAGDTGTDYDPTGHLLICCEGEFNSQSPTDTQLGSVAALMAWASTRYGVGLEKVLGHRDVASTSCPGDMVYNQLDSLEARARQLMDGPGLALVMLDGQVAVDLVADIETGRL